MQRQRIPPTPPRGGGDEAEKAAEAIYQAYPRKIARLKAIQTIIRTLQKVDAEALLSAVIRYAKTPGLERDNGRYIPSPVTWFNEERWKDYLPEPTSPVIAILRPSKALDDVRVMLSRHVELSAEECDLTRIFIERLIPTDFDLIDERERVQIENLRNASSSARKITDISSDNSQPKKGSQKNMPKRENSHE